MKTNRRPCPHCGNEAIAALYDRKRIGTPGTWRIQCPLKCSEVFALTLDEAERLWDDLVIDVLNIQGSREALTVKAE